MTTCDRCKMRVGRHTRLDGRVLFPFSTHQVAPIMSWEGDLCKRCFYDIFVNLRDVQLVNESGQPVGSFGLQAERGRE